MLSKKYKKQLGLLFFEENFINFEYENQHRTNYQ